MTKRLLNIAVLFAQRNGIGHLCVGWWTPLLLKPGYCSDGYRRERFPSQTLVGNVPLLSSSPLVSHPKLEDLRLRRPNAQLVRWWLRTTVVTLQYKVKVNTGDVRYVKRERLSCAKSASVPCTQNFVSKFFIRDNFSIFSFLYYFGIKFCYWKIRCIIFFVVFRLQAGITFKYKLKKPMGATFLGSNAQ